MPQPGFTGEPADLEQTDPDFSGIANNVLYHLKKINFLLTVAIFNTYSIRKMIIFH